MSKEKLLLYKVDQKKNGYTKLR